MGTAAGTEASRLDLLGSEVLATARLFRGRAPKVVSRCSAQSAIAVASTTENGTQAVCSPITMINMVDRPSHRRRWE